MPFGSLGTYACQRLQDDYVSYFGKNSAAFKTGGSTALIKFLLSPQNTRGFKQISVNGVPGKKRGVAFRYDNPFCFTLCAPSVDCTTVRTYLTNPSQEIAFDLTANAFRVCDGSGVPMKLKFLRSDLMKYCTINDETYIKDQIIRFLMRFEEAFDSALATILAPLAGTSESGDAITLLPFFVQNSATGTYAINSDAMFWLDQNFMDILGNGQYALVGGKVLNKINKVLGWTGLNQAGLDLSALDTLNPYTYYDRNMNSILTPNDFLQISPGAVQLVTWAENAGPYATEVTDLYSNGSIISPTTGLRIDWDWRYDYECKAWTFEPFIYAELAVNKAGGCAVNSLDTTNGIIRYTDCSNALTAPTCPA